jgi:glycerol-3-phosphate acyltransferase PlsY
MERLIALLIGYLLGGIQTAVLYGKIKGIDIREHGSGNAGTTNTLRILGKKAALIVFLGDILKAIAAVLIAKYLFRAATPVFGFYAGLGAILGHNYPVFFKFKGGKGIAVTVGAIYFIDFKIALIATVLFLVCVGITRFVSLSSLFLTGSIPFSILFFYRDKIGYMELVALGATIFLLTVYSHRQNIQRLIKGSESKLGQKNR